MKSLTLPSPSPPCACGHPPHNPSPPCACAHPPQPLTAFRLRSPSPTPHRLALALTLPNRSLRLPWTHVPASASNLNNRAVQPNERTFSLMMLMHLHRTARPLEVVRTALKWARFAGLEPHERLSNYITRPCEMALQLLSDDDGTDPDPSGRRRGGGGSFRTHAHPGRSDRLCLAMPCC